MSDKGSLGFARSQDKEKVLAEVRGIISSQLGTDLDKVGPYTGMQYTGIEFRARERQFGPWCLVTLIRR